MFNIFLPASIATTVSLLKKVNNIKSNIEKTIDAVENAPTIIRDGMDNHADALNNLADKNEEAAIILQQISDKLIIQLEKSVDKITAGIIISIIFLIIGLFIVLLIYSYIQGSLRAEYIIDEIAFILINLFMYIMFKN